MLELKPGKLVHILLIEMLFSFETLVLLSLLQLELVAIVLLIG